MASKIQLRRDLAENWADNNPILAQGEPGLETDTGRVKYGDGTTAWNGLDYASGGSASTGNWEFVGNVATVTGANLVIKVDNSDFGPEGLLSTLPQIKLDQWWEGQARISNNTPGEWLILQTTDQDFGNIDNWNTGRTSVRWHARTNSTDEGPSIYSQVDVQNDGVWVKNANWGGKSSYWHFDTDGALNFPTNDNNIKKQRWGMGNIAAYHDGGWTICTYDGENYGAGGDGIGISPSVEGYGWIYVPSDFQSNAVPVQISNGNETGNVQVGAFNNTWMFNYNGTLSFPSVYTNNRTGTAEALVFKQSGSQKAVATQNGTADNNTVERLVLAGGDSYFDGTNWFGEGGDIYLWAGRGADGGDIKIDAGEAHGLAGQEGGGIKIRGGASSYGNGGYLQLTAGQGQVANGGYIDITAGYGNNNGGDVNITAGNGGTQSGQITLNTISHQWILSPNGSTTFPNGSRLNNSNPYQFATDNTVTTTVDLRDTQGAGFYTNGSSFTLRSNGDNSWVFNSDGSVTFPDNTIQTTAYIGGGITFGNANIAAWVMDHDLNSMGNLYVGNPNGRHHIEGNLVIGPENSNHAAGDTAFTIVSDESIPILSNAVIHINGANSKPTSMSIDSFSSASSIILRRTRGTTAAPTAVGTNDLLGAFIAKGYGLSGYSTSNASATSGMAIYANESFSDSVQGTYVDIKAIPVGGINAVTGLRVTSNTTTVSGSLVFSDGTSQTTAYSKSSTFNSAWGTTVQLDNIRAKIDTDGTPKLSVVAGSNNLMWSTTVNINSALSAGGTSSPISTTTSNWWAVSGTAMSHGSDSVVLLVQNITTGAAYRVSYVNGNSSSGTVAIEKLA